MNGRNARALRRCALITKTDEPRKYYHYNAHKAAKKLKADYTDPIVAETKRQVYQAAKKVFGVWHRMTGQRNTAAVLQWVRQEMSGAASDRLAQGKA